MKKYNLYESLEILDSIKRQHDIEKISEFDFSEIEGYTAAFEEKRMLEENYTLKKGLIKNEMIFFVEKSVTVNNYKNVEILINKSPYVKILYGNTDDINTVSVSNINNYDKICLLFKEYIEKCANRFSDEDLNAINHEIIKSTKGIIEMEKKHKKIIKK